MDPCDLANDFAHVAQGVGILAKGDDTGSALLLTRPKYTPDPFAYAFHGLRVPSGGCIDPEIVTARVTWGHQRSVPRVQRLIDRVADDQMKSIRNRIVL